VVELVAVKRTEAIVDSLTEDERTFGNYFPGRFAWALANVRRLPEAVPLRGQQGLWTAPDFQLIKGGYFETNKI
jgi:hypothetical protein